jgi:predicted ribosomally synthesized peptide with SipW-like signal peptide
MKKIALLSLALVLALGGLGIGYAAWTDTVTVDGTVHTGEVCIEFESCDLLDEAPLGQPINPGGDYPTANADYNSLPGFAPNPDEGNDRWWLVDKNVGWGEQLIGNNPDTPGDRDLLEIWLNNTYPMYFNRLTFYVHNCGTIPVKINRVWIDGQSITPGDLVRFDFNQDGNADFEIYWGNAIGLQLEPCDSAEVSLWLAVLQPCPQGQLDSQHFNITVEAVQWNEYPYNGSP